ncbi:MFS family permease [Amycolatopsis endophytica]|uniref:MFS family permease n=1 Tax=Amycolatopsis endophytica TaxID=860233 RepID=A0A853AYB8_9PSEU|nr:MFS transporter [Amycolatopsis endophytica]NYI87571.1 MFS family permease [Amycolatopsis endophytica]
MLTPSTSRLGSRYWRLWSAASLSSLADGTLKIALPLLARAHTDAPVLIAGVGFTAALPWLLFSLPAGAIVDRADRRRVLIGANLARAALLSVAAVAGVAGAGSIAVLYVVAFGAGVTETLYASAAQAVVPRLVEHDRLDRANSLQQIADQAANQFAGPALGGLLAGLGVGAALGGPALVWSLAAGMLVTLHGAFRARPAARGSLGADIVAGLRFLAASRVLRSVSLCVAITNFAGAAASAVFVVYAVGPGSALGLAPTGFGLLMTASAVGSVAGSALITAATARLGLRALLMINSGSQAAQILVPVLTHDLWAIGTAYALGGLGVALWNIGTVTLRQRLVPEALLGRLISTHRLISWGSLALGSLAGGVVAQTVGLAALFWAATALTLTGMLALTPLTTALVDGEVSRRES